MRAPLRPLAGAFLVLLLGLAAGPSGGSGELRHGVPTPELLLMRVDVLEAGDGSAEVQDALGGADSAAELDRRLARAVETGVARSIASADEAITYDVPVKLELDDGTHLEVTPLGRDYPRRIRTLVRERRRGETHSRVVEIPLDRSTALPTGALVVPTADGERLLALRVELRP